MWQREVTCNLLVIKEENPLEVVFIPDDLYMILLYFRTQCLCVDTTPTKACQLKPLPDIVGLSPYPL